MTGTEKTATIETGSSLVCSLAEHCTNSIGDTFRIDCRRSPTICMP